MRNLIIERIKYIIETKGGKSFGADVPFNLGLNIIYGPNSVGKSSLVTGIVYCLGGEKGLGIFQNKQNPFKPEFYDRINDDPIIKSYVQLQISNGKQTVTLARSIINKTDVVGVKETTIDMFSLTSKIKYLIASGEGVFSADGLQKYLFDFIGWEIVSVPTYETSVTKLYFENLVPLFFVEQRAGWSQIQARQVLKYGIREVKKVAFEYLMGLDKFDIHIKEIERKELQEKLLRLKRELKEKEENIVVLVNGKINDDVILIDRVGLGRGSIHDLLGILQKSYNAGTKELEELGTSTDNSESQKSSLRDNLRIIGHQIRRVVEKINLLGQEIASYENYLDRININKQKNKQLKKIEGLAMELNISTCPVCENPLTINEEDNCKLCHHELKRKISTPEENLEFLEDEKSSFEKILEAKRLDLKKAKHNLQELKSVEKTISEDIDHQINTYIGPQLDKYRKKVSELDILFKEIELYKRVIERWCKLESIRNEIVENEKADAKLKKLIDDYRQSGNDNEIMSKLIELYRDDVKKLRLLKGKDNLISLIKIDETDVYTPYLDEYDLYNISSSSDNVRIILCYYLALLQTSISLPNNSKIRFPNLLILDEPKQQNLDDKDINTFIDILEHLPKNSCQVILTTFSEQKRNKNLFKDYIRHEMIDEMDFLLKEIKKS